MTDAAGEDATIRPRGIGGWLILPILGLFLTIPSGALLSVQSVAAFGLLRQMTAVQAAIVVAEPVGNMLIAVVAPICLLVLAFRRKRTFPKMYVRWAVADLAFVLVDLAAASVAFSEVLSNNTFDEDTVKAIARAVILVVVWVPYMLKSRRVANTFVS